MAKNLDFRRPHTARAGILKLYYTAMLEGLALETFPSDMAAEFFEEAVRGRSASHDLQATLSCAKASKSNSLVC